MIFEAEWYAAFNMKKRLNLRGLQLFKKHKTIFSIVDEPPSWSDADDSLESMSDPDEEDDMPDDKDSSSHSGVGDVDVEVDVEVDTREEEEEEDSDDFFDAGEGAVVGDRSSRAASESSQSGGGTEDDPVGPTTPSATAAPQSNPISHKTTAVVGFSRTISSDSADIDDDDEEWVDPTPIPATPLEPAPPAFPPPIVTKTKSSSSAKSSRKRKEARAANVPFPSNVMEGEDCPRPVPQMSTARGRDGGRTQSGRYCAGCRAA